MGKHSMIEITRVGTLHFQDLTNIDMFSLFFVSVTRKTVPLKEVTRAVS